MPETAINSEQIKELLKNPLVVTRELNNRSLYHFLEYFWPVYSSQPFSSNWHLKLLCKELEKIAERVSERKPRYYDLICNVPPGTTKPLHEETDILMGDGSYKKLKNIIEGDFVINRFGNPIKVTGVHIQGNLPCVNIHTFGGRDVRAAYDHPILTADGWKNAGDIKNGQMLALMHTAKIHGTTERDIDEFRLAGYFIGDGSISSGNCRVSGKDLEYLKDLTDCVIRLGFDYSTYIDRNNVTNITIKCKLRTEKTKTGTFKGMGRGYKEPRGPRKWLDDIGIRGATSKTKKVPDFVFNGTDEQIKAFLAAYFHCDGCVSYRHNSPKRNIVISVCTISKELAIGLQRLFLRIGISMKIRTRIAKSGFAYNRELKNYEYYTVDTTDQDSAVRFLEQVPLIGYKLEKLKVFSPRKKTFQQEYWPDEVVSVNEAGTLPCRCLSVSEGESFIADGVVVHNTALVSIMFPIWCWTRWHWMLIITISYSDKLSLESADYCRDILRSQRFQELYPDIMIKEDKDVKSNFRIARKIPGAGGVGRQSKQMTGGGRVSTSLTGTIMGFHGDILIVDDPLNPTQAASEIELANANHFMEQTLSLRKRDKDVTPTILIMQRLHMDDPSGHWLAKEEKNVRHICLPGEIRNFKQYVNPPEYAEFYSDNLLDAKRLSWDTLKGLESRLGQYGYAGQIGQNPVPPGGGMFKVDRFIIATSMPPRYEIMHTIRAWDKAGTTDGGAYTVGVKMSKLINNRWLVEDVVRGQWASQDRERVIKSVAEADGTGVEIWMEMEPGSSGKESAEATIRNLGGFRAYAEHATGAKPERADPYSVQVNNGGVQLLNGIWNREYIEECRFFPASTYKDQVDASSLAFSKLQSKKIARRIT